MCIVDNAHFGMTWHVMTQDVKLRKCLERKWMMSVIEISYILRAKRYILIFIIKMNTSCSLLHEE